MFHSGPRRAATSNVGPVQRQSVVRMFRLSRRGAGPQARPPDRCPEGSTTRSGSLPPLPPLLPQSWQASRACCGRRGSGRGGPRRSQRVAAVKAQPLIRTSRTVASSPVLRRTTRTEGSQTPLSDWDLRSLQQGCRTIDQMHTWFAKKLNSIAKATAISTSITTTSRAMRNNHESFSSCNRESVQTQSKSPCKVAEDI